MQAVKAVYKEGQVQLLEPLADNIKEAELFVIVLDENKEIMQTKETAESEENRSEIEFKAIGLDNFFNTNDDNNIDWEEVFNVKPR